MRWLSWPRCPRLAFKEPQKLKADAAHAEALLDSHELLQQLHDHGVFDLLRGALGASDRLIETAVDATKSNESIRAKYEPLGDRGSGNPLQSALGVVDA